MPLPRHDDRPLPSRRALREAERARDATPAAVPVTTRRELREQRVAAVGCAAAPGPAVPARPDRRARGDRRPRPTPVVPPPAPSVRVLDDHVLEGGDDVWVDDVAPRPTPVAGRVVTDPVPVAAASGRRSPWRRVPQMLVVGSLVAATAGFASATATDMSAVSGVAAAADEVPQFVREEVAVVAAPAAPAAAAVVDLDAGSSLVPGEDGLLRVDPQEASRDGERSVLPGCDGVPPEVEQPNGDIDESFLCTLFDGRTEIRADAAVSLALLNEEYRAELGRDMCITDGYRSYAAQQSLRARKPGLAAPAGTSEHGYGLAVDLCGGVETAGPAYDWLRENAGEHGFENPRWAQRGGSGPYEPWHWEYTAGQW